ncbi:hypothetical protein JG687_00009792 [Phytophthora cactorum]|uniref:Uncharacterized protein n=1 Tax=Phytophthora cactorum TaxID=29920 RepID=A0A8T1UCX6_9STRA|nr:hypothetical protein JG687_00009792 [Phytophthora cactorum]
MSTLSRCSRVRCPLLCMAPLVNAETDDLSAASHHAILDTMLGRDYGKSIQQCLFLVGDNWSVNHRLAVQMGEGVPLVGFASARINRAVSQCLSECADVLDSVQALKVKMRSLHHSAILW